MKPIGVEIIQKRHLKANVHGTLKILDMAKNAGCRHFFFSDTSAEYDGFDDDETYFPYSGMDGT